MLICPNCNKEFDHDDSVFCNACGTKLVPKEVPEVVDPVVAIVPEESFLVTLFTFVAKAAQIVSAFFAAVALATPYIYVGLRSSYVTTEFSPGVGSSVFAFLFALGAVGLSVVSFIFTLKKQGGIKTLFPKILDMGSGLLLFILSIVLLVQQ